MRFNFTLWLQFQHSAASKRQESQEGYLGIIFSHGSLVLDFDIRCLEL